MTGNDYSEVEVLQTIFTEDIKLEILQLTNENINAILKNVVFRKGIDSEEHIANANYEHGTIKEKISIYS